MLTLFPQAGWNNLLGAVRNRNSLPDDIRELMVRNVVRPSKSLFNGYLTNRSSAWPLETRRRSNGSVRLFPPDLPRARPDPVLADHAHVGTDAGLTAQQLTVIRDVSTPLPTPASPSPLSAYQAAALRFADASTYNVTVPQSYLDELKQHLKDDQQLLEATAVVATYNMVSRLLVTLDVGDMGEQSVPLPESEQSEHDVEVEEGVKLHVRVAKRGDDAPWLVFVNSLMTNQKMWDGVLPRLSKKYNLITFDQRGHGKVRGAANLLELQELTRFPAVIGPAQPLHSRDSRRRHRRHPLQALNSYAHSCRHRCLARRRDHPRFCPAPLHPLLPPHRMRHPGDLARRQRQGLGRAHRPCPAAQLDGTSRRRDRPPVVPLRLDERIQRRRKAAVLHSRHDYLDAD